MYNGPLTIRYFGLTQVCVKCLYSLMKVCLLTGCYSIASTRRCDFALLCNKYLYAQVA